jgi:ApbE superfamily uncharacterized protein (UPF0280 family)
MHRENTMKRHTVRIKETIATILAEEHFIPLAVDEILRQRDMLEKYIKEVPLFRTCLEPMAVEKGAPEIAVRMARASALAGVGPMATVAGAIAEFSLRAMMKAGAAHAVVDNGGDIAMTLAHSITVGIFTGPARIQNIGLKFPPHPGIIGVCTSSGTVGHSLSSGRADAATVVSSDVCLADAVATALGNSASDKDSRSIKHAMNRLWIEGVEGMMVIMDDLIGVGGNLPDIIHVPMDTEKISKG